MPSSADFRALCQFGSLIVWNGAVSDIKVWRFQPFEDNAQDQIKLQNDQSIIRHSKCSTSSNGSDESGNTAGVTRII